MRQAPPEVQAVLDQAYLLAETGGAPPAAPEPYQARVIDYAPRLRARSRRRKVIERVILLVMAVIIAAAIFTALYGVHLITVAR